MEARKEDNRLRKTERLKSRILIESLFGDGSRSIAAYPLRLVYKLVEARKGEAQVQILVSVPKRCFKRAVKRNRVKRQVREAYRKNKSIVDSERLKEEGCMLLIAFIWLDNELHSSDEVERKVVNLLKRVEEKLGKNKTIAKNKEENGEQAM